MNNSKPLQQLSEIRAMMERSSRFISLSGLSGVLAGTYALLGAFYVKYTAPSNKDSLIQEVMWEYLGIACIVMFLSLLTGYILTQRRAKSQGRLLLDKTSMRLLINLVIPIATGGIFAIILLSRSYIELLAPVMLMFYGIGLINGSKYTFDDIRYLGLTEVALGLMSAFDPGNGLIYWSLGFGVMHILYGGRMWWKYERNTSITAG